jgi:protein tyrosine phosphatase (PTP) superfamily phosphohydrolase (DUF442 family)
MADALEALSDIRNFVLVEGRIGTAGQPSEAQLAVVAAAGFDRVINLGLLDPKYCLADEAACATGLGMAYQHIPVRFDAPALDDFTAFVAAMDATPTDARVFVHCAANYRVSAFVGLWAELRLGWTREKADQHGSRFWQPNPVWQAFIAACRARFIDPSAPASADR